MNEQISIRKISDATEDIYEVKIHGKTSSTAHIVRVDGLYTGQLIVGKAASIEELLE